MNTIKLKCETCGKIFDKPKNEYNRRIKHGKNKFYCGYSCNSKRKENIEHIKKQKSSIDISKYSNNRYDEYSVFKYYLSIISRKNYGRKGNVDIDLKYLKFLWESQDGICPIAGIKMQLKGQRKGKANPYQASIDRIDSNLPYQKGNIRYICLIANFARHTFGDEVLFDFCEKTTSFMLDKSKL
jgi:hypothetical protein